MLQSQVVKHFQVQSDQLMAGTLDGFGEMFALPLPIHFPGGLTVLQGSVTGHLFLNQMRDELLGRGVVAMRPEISAIELPRDGRFRVWIDWTEITATGQELQGSSIVYFCRRVATGLRTEMMQYTHLSSPGMVAAPSPVARSA